VFPHAAVCTVQQSKVKKLILTRRDFTNFFMRDFEG